MMRASRWALGVAIGLVSLSAAASERPPLDARDLASIAARHPGTVALLERGEAAALAGNLKDAIDFLDEAAAQAPESALVARRRCEALTLAGKRAEAMGSCMKAVKNGGSAMDLRAMVAASMSGDRPPSTTELAQAMRLARRAKDVDPLEPWGYAAECDIAERIGDAKMLETCVGELQRIAPDHEETRRALASVARFTATWRAGLACAFLLVVALGTLAHALRQAFRGGGRRPRVASAGAAALVVCFGSSMGAARADSPAAPAASSLAPAGAARGVGSAAASAAHPSEPGAGAEGPEMPAEHGMLSQWPVDDKDPESSVPSDQRKERNPLQFGYWLMDLTYKAERATKSGDYPAAIRFYKALVKAVPDRSVSFTRLCESYEANGEWDNAMEACGTALSTPGVTLAEYRHYFDLALAKKGALSYQEVDALQKVLVHLRDDPAGKDAVDELQCQLGVRQEDVGLLEPCTAALAAVAPQDPRTLSFEWALAVARGDLDEAKRVIERARASGMKPEGIEQMEHGLEVVQAKRRHRLYAWGFGGLGVLLAAAGVAFFFATRRRDALAPQPLASQGSA